MKKKNDPEVYCKASVERFTHFSCGACKKWWGIGDPPPKRKIWHCPWCGVKQTRTSF